MKLFTIGLTKSSAKSFFARLSGAHVKKLVDVRLNNVSQLAGFLRYFAKSIAGIGYEHIPELAPTQDMLDEYKKSKGSWAIYAERFLDLMARRKIENIDQTRLDGGCLLCSEDKPHHCHRRRPASTSPRRSAPCHPATSAVAAPTRPKPRPHRLTTLKLSHRSPVLHHHSISWKRSEVGLRRNPPDYAGALNSSLWGRALLPPPLLCHNS